MFVKADNIAFFVAKNKKSSGKLLIFAVFVYIVENEGNKRKRRSAGMKRVFGLYKVGGTRMLNYEEELAKFQPSLEIDQAEEAILNNDLTDLSDLLEQVVTGKKERK